MEPAYEYERFVCDAFGLVNGGWVDRFGDPAEFADTDTFTAGNLPVVKAGTGYAMGVLVKKISGKGRAASIEAMNGYIERVIAAPDVQTVAEVIAEFRESIVDVHFDRVDMVLQPK